ncbi:MAG: hypothetical protein A2498_02725 [Lentisphaerae bacterium RIFOXYC12_FULL_60_16]|nr:MAG: hypothetical protein A2498_02725 [Lentisphaerae bacterium RIFOXYC12_FULL_60_16]
MSMNASAFLMSIVLTLGISIPARGDSGNLVRNASFRDDWLTLLPELKNHNWNYAGEFYNRRDYNPDTWELKGSWEWINPDAPREQRRLVLRGPKAEVKQLINWNAVHDPRSSGGLFPDAGGYPGLVHTTSPRPERLVRDLALRIRSSATDIPPGACTAFLRLGPPPNQPVTVFTNLPSGSYSGRWTTVVLPASLWLKASGTVVGAESQLPDLVEVGFSYTNAAGQAVIEAVVLTSTDTDSANLLQNGGFESLDKDGYPGSWSKAQKYTYFPPGYYYIFNTWHNTSFDNRGKVGADELLVHEGRNSFRMTVPAGDEVCIVSDPISLNQAQPRLIEVNAMVRTETLAMMQIDAVDENGARLDAFNFIHKMPVSAGSDGWRQVRQIFRPRAAVKTMRLQLCARGVNGFTLGGTGLQPQNNAVGIIWWDDIRLYEPESTTAELTTRGVKPAGTPKAGLPEHPIVASLDPGERLMGENMLTAIVTNPGSSGTWDLELAITSPTSSDDGKPVSRTIKLDKKGTVRVEIPYTVAESCPGAYSEYRATLRLATRKGETVAISDIPFATWRTPIDIELGSTYLQPDATRQFVRMNFGLSGQSMANAKAVRLEVMRRNTGKALGSAEIPATPAAIAAQRTKIPADLREDFRNLILADVDIAALPVQPFGDPQRNWIIRATLLDQSGKTMAMADSVPFCRLAHDPAQPAIQTVTITTNNLLFVNGQPWMPWGVTYGHNPIYEGPADPGAGKYRDLHNFATWPGLYDRHGGYAADRALTDVNCLRYVAGGVSPIDQLEKRWTEKNLYCSSAFVVPQPVWSMEELVQGAGGQEKLNAYLAFCKSAPMVVSTAPGIEEAFGSFCVATPEQLAGMGRVVEHLRQVTGKPVMVGHGGYWNRFEYEKVPWFDIYDPETEPLYPANLHTDMKPLIDGKAKVAWLRPQMYENVPYERWRFHVWVELMRGARGWQIAHGPGDTTLFRGLHGEMELIKPVVYSPDFGPAVSVEPWLEHWSRRHNGKTYIAAATTHGLANGRWHWAEDAGCPAGRARVTGLPAEWRSEDNGYGINQELFRGPSLHAMQNLPDARKWPAGSRLIQWVKLDPSSMPSNLVIMAKSDGRWSHGVSWGEFSVKPYRQDATRAGWFLRALYRHASGFLGWGNDLALKMTDYIVEHVESMGPVPAADKWWELDVPLEKLAAVGPLVDGVAFLHETGRVWWGPTTIVTPNGTTNTVFGNNIGLPEAQRERVKMNVAGLKAGTAVRVLFEDREIKSGDGFFIDDFRGQDLYQRFGGGHFTGYSDEPVALHIYEVPL